MDKMGLHYHYQSQPFYEENIKFFRKTWVKNKKASRFYNVRPKIFKTFDILLLVTV